MSIHKRLTRLEHWQGREGPFAYLTDTELAEAIRATATHIIGDPTATPEEVEHARRALERSANHATA